MFILRETIVIKKCRNRNRKVKEMSENLRNLTAVTYYLALFLLLAYLFGGIAGVDLPSMIRNGFNAVIILLQQLFSSITVHVPSVV